MLIAIKQIMDVWIIVCFPS